MVEYLNYTWIVAGVSRAGKTTLANNLAKISKLQFVDMDQLVQASRDITEPYWELDEVEFRRLEFSIYDNFKPELGMVIALGGGALLNDKLAKIVSKWGYVGWLFTDKSIILNRWKVKPLSIFESDLDHQYANRARVSSYWSSTIWDHCPKKVLQQMSVIAQYGD